MSDRRLRRWCVMDLVTDPISGTLKETLLYSNLGKVSALIWFSWKCYNDRDTEMLWLIVMGILTAHAVFSQFIMSKLGVKPDATVTTTATAEVVTTTKKK